MKKRILLNEMRLQYGLIIILLMMIQRMNCDLPIQCVKHQIIGKWKIQIYKTYHNPNGFIQCGHSIPDNPQTSFLSLNKKFKVHQEYIIDLLENGQANLYENNQIIQGNWSMMYDEGLSIEIQQRSYLTYFKYDPIKEEEIEEDIKIDMITLINHSKKITYEYDCTETIVGWYSDYQQNIKGCMRAFKINPENVNKHLRSETKGIVLQPIDTDINNFQFQEEGDQEGFNMSFTDLILDQTLFSNKNKKGKNKNNSNNNNNINTASYPFENDEQQLDEFPTDNINENNKENKEQNSIENTLESVTQRIFENQSHHQDRVQQLNSINKNWQAGISTSFKDLSLDQLNKKSGRKSRKSEIKKKSKTNTNANTKQNTNQNEIQEEIQNEQNNQNISNLINKSDDDDQIDMYMHFSINDVSDLPKELSWEEYIDKPLAQNECGSCYIISTVSMLNARLKIKYGKSFNQTISMQHLLDCSFYSQGCEGGYPFELGRFGKDYFMIPERLEPFQNEVKECKYNKLSKLDDYFKITSYGFVGKQYGRGNEREMMLEIMNNGPIVANFKTNADFVYYQSGVYHTVSAADWILQCQKEPEWRPVEHAVMCYGWGESEKDGKYWLMQNSWGEDWGEKGRFKIRRGTDESFIESSAEFAQVEYIQKNQSSY